MTRQDVMQVKQDTESWPNMIKLIAETPWERHRTRTSINYRCSIWDDGKQGWLTGAKWQPPQRLRRCRTWSAPRHYSKLRAWLVQKRTRHSIWDDVNLGHQKSICSSNRREGQAIALMGFPTKGMWCGTNRRDGIQRNVGEDGKLHRPNVCVSATTVN